MLEEVNEQPEQTVIELTKEQFETSVQLCNDMEELNSNKAFQRIVRDAYMMNEVERLGGLLSCTHNNALMKDTAIIVEKIKAVGYLRTFLQKIEDNTKGFNTPDMRREFEAQLATLAEGE